MLMRRTQSGADLVVAPATRETFDAVTAAADPRHAFLRHAWFEADAGARLRALVVQRADGSPLAALPRVRRGIGAVPGSYWPFRSFPIAADASDAELTGLLARREVRSFLTPVWRMGPVFADDPTAARLREAAPAAGWTVLARHLGTSFELDFHRLRAEGPWPRTSSQASNRRRERKLAAHGELEFRFLTGRDWTDADRGITRVDWGSGDAGYKSEMGATQGPEIVDLLFVRAGLPAAALRRWWSR